MCVRKHSPQPMVVQSLLSGEDQPFSAKGRRPSLPKVAAHPQKPWLQAQQSLPESAFVQSPQGATPYPQGQPPDCCGPGPR